MLDNASFCYQLPGPPIPGKTPYGALSSISGFKEAAAQTVRLKGGAPKHINMFGQPPTHCAWPQGSAPPVDSGNTCASDPCPPGSLDQGRKFGKE
jgi:hypothetical protein